MDKKVTIYDIATAAGVSPATVSRMIHQPNIVTKQQGKNIRSLQRLWHPAEFRDKKNGRKKRKNFCGRRVQGGISMYPRVGKPIL